MRIIKVTTKAQLDELYIGSFAIEGVVPNEKNLKELLGIVKQYTPLWRDNVYTIEGAVMNREYNLTGTNAYHDADTIVCVKYLDMKEPITFAFWRFKIAWQFFDKICDRKLHREKENKENE